MDETALAQMIKARTIAGMVKELSEERPGDVHVTDIVYDCLRLGFYNVKNNIHEEEVSGDEKTLMTLWIGKMLHKMPLSLRHEFELEYMGVHGTLDEAWVFKDGDETVLLILDKKTTTYPVKGAMEHHVEQVSYYAVMYVDTAKVEFDRVYGAVEYFNVDTKELTVFVFPINLGEARERFSSKVEMLKDALKNDRLPPAHHSWRCKYCRWFSECMLADSVFLER